MTNEEREKATLELTRLKREVNACAYYIHVNVLRNGNGYDCTNGGETAQCDCFTLFTHRMNRNAVILAIEEMGLNPAECLQVENRKPCGNDYYNAVLLTPGRRDKWHSFGGNFVYSSDSRYREVTSLPYPISVHDRVEE